jgi:hypothetical protein
LSQQQIKKLEALGFVWAPGRGYRSSEERRITYSKLSEKAALRIYKDPRPTREIAKEYSIATGHVRQIKRGRAWAHVTGHKTGAAE